MICHRFHEISPIHRGIRIVQSIVQAAVGVIAALQPLTQVTGLRCATISDDQGQHSSLGVPCRSISRKLEKIPMSTCYSPFCRFNQFHLFSRCIMLYFLRTYLYHTIHTHIIYIYIISYIFVYDSVSYRRYRYHQSLVGTTQHIEGRSWSPPSLSCRSPAGASLFPKSWDLRRRPVTCSISSLIFCLQLFWSKRRS